jgi:hypothetical protein
MRYYIDESGNSGDLVRTRADLEFHGQSVFSLAAVGTMEEVHLAVEVERLKQKHRIRSNEIKSSSVRDKPQFIRELIEVVVDGELPWFIELVDKRYMICAQIVNSQLLPPDVTGPESPSSVFVKNTMADALFFQATTDTLNAFVAACKAPSFEAVKKCLWMLAVMKGDRRAAEVIEGIKESATASLGELLEDPSSFARFLPIPDQSKRQEPVWMLPNLSSLMNIYARINKRHRRDLNGVELVHDEQAHFDEILIENKSRAESLRNTLIQSYVPNSDYNFVGKASMSFARSDQHPGLQVADVFAGFSMRYLKNQRDGVSVDPIEFECFRALMNATDASAGVGINLVVPTQAANGLWHRR